MRKILLLLIMLPFFGHAQIISTYAGNGISGWSGDDSAATISKIDHPYGLGVDDNDNLMICHYNAVRKVNPITGIIRTIAGSDTASSLGGGGDGGSATCALVASPKAVFLNRINNLLIVDGWAIEIRQVDFSTGIIFSFAGSGSSGNSGDGGPATAAKFNTIVGGAIDTSLGYVYVADEFNYRIRKINIATGVITAFAGTGTNGFSGDSGVATAAKLSRTLGVCVDKNHNVFIGDWDNARIRKVDTAGIITTYAGTGTSGYLGDNGTATAARITKPTGICVDSSGNLYFTDETNQRVRKIDAVTKVITTVAGNGTAGFLGDGGLATTAEFHNPTGIAIDRSGNLFVSDFFNNRVRKITPGGTGINDVTQTKNICISPNPAQSEIAINASDKISNIILTNLVGKEVFRQVYTEPEQVTIDIAHLAAGMYFVKAMCANGRVYVERVVKE